jgi:peptide/nickel transport system substrate-binding protein
MKRFVFIFIILCSACHTEQSYQNKRIFRYNVGEGITSLDPAFARSLDNVSAVNQLFNGLVQTDSLLLPKACIAKRWEVLDSGRAYRFHLRQDVFFHKHPAFGEDSTRKVVAEDFVYSFNRLIDPVLLSPGKWVMNSVARKEDGHLKIEVQDDSTLTIYLTKAFPPFMGILSMQYCAVVPQEVIAYDPEEFRSRPIGTGPFKFQYWKENNKLVYLKNEQYFETNEAGERLPFLDAIAISFIKDQEVSFLKFLKGEFDYLSGLKGSYKDELLDSKGDLREKYHQRITFKSIPYLNTEYLGFLVEEQEGRSGSVVKNKLLRKAINYGFDRDKMLTYLRNGIGYPATSGFIPRGLPSFSDTLKGYSYQPDSVKSLLARAGYPNGDDLPPIRLTTTAEYLDICEYLQSELAAFGILLKIEVNQAAVSNELIANAQADFFRKSWVADYPDAENYLSLFKQDNFSPQGPNYTHFKNEYFDLLYKKAMAETNDSMRFCLYQRMDSIILAESPVVPLFYDQVVRFTQPYIQGLDPNPMNLLVLKNTIKPLE